MDNDTGGTEFPWQWLVVLPYAYALWAVQWVLDQVAAWFDSVF